MTNKFELALVPTNPKVDDGIDWPKTSNKRAGLSGPTPIWISPFGFTYEIGPEAEKITGGSLIFLCGISYLNNQYYTELFFPMLLRNVFIYESFTTIGICKLLIRTASPWFRAVHFTGKMLDGTVFASTRETNTPMNFKLRQGESMHDKIRSLLYISIALVFLIPVMLYMYFYIVHYKMYCISLFKNTRRIVYVFISILSVLARWLFV